VVTDEPWTITVNPSTDLFEELAEAVRRLRAGARVRMLGTLVQAVTDEQPRPLAVGDVLAGFCGGLFGRESYEDKTVEVIGADYVVARTDRAGGGIPEFFRGDPSHLISHRR
jgi:hypothetical protein